MSRLESAGGEELMVEELIVTCFNQVSRGPGIIGEEAGSETWPTEPFLSGQNLSEGCPEPPEVPELSGATQKRVLCYVQ